MKKRTNDTDVFYIFFIRFVDAHEKQGCDPWLYTFGKLVTLRKFVNRVATW